jgi:hypothetical protein
MQTSLVLLSFAACAPVVPDSAAPARPIREVAVAERSNQRIAEHYWRNADTVRMHLDSNTVYRFVVTRGYAAHSGSLTFWPADSAPPTTPLAYHRLLQTFPYGDRAVAMLFTAPRSEDYLFLAPPDVRVSFAEVHTSWAPRHGAGTN